MSGKISLFIPYSNSSDAKTMEEFTQKSIDKIFLLTFDSNLPSVEGCEKIDIGNLHSRKTINKISELVKTDYALILSENSPIYLEPSSLEKFLSTAENSKAGFVYSDYYVIKEGGKTLSLMWSPIPSF